MNVGEVCNRNVVVTHRATPLAEAARIMRENHVGSIVVVDEDAGRRVPVGMLTDRDIVVAVVARELDARTLMVGEVMSLDPISVREEASSLDALEAMRRHGVRRIPVLGRDGELAGIVAFDDLLRIVGEEIEGFVRAITVERVQEAHFRK